jgi:hypothetical protein
MITTVGKPFSDDDAYVGNKILDTYRRVMKSSCTKVRKNAKIKLKDGNFFRHLSIISQKNDLQKWKDSVSYGQRWML